VANASPENAASNGQGASKPASNSKSSDNDWDMFAASMNAASPNNNGTSGVESKRSGSKSVSATPNKEEDDAAANAPEPEFNLSTSNKKKAAGKSILSTKSKGGKLGKASVLASGGPAGQMEPLEAAFAPQPVKSEEIKPAMQKDNAGQDENKDSENEAKKKEENKRKKEEYAPSSDRFSKATSISSDQYFQRGDYAETSADDKTRLSKYSDAQAISSDQFFDREEPVEVDDDALDLTDLKRAVVSKGKQFLQMLRG
jgi:hypothetical protein